MSGRVRRRFFLFAAAGLLGLLGAGMAGLAPFGHYPGPDGDVLTAIAPNQRHVLNVVSAVMFDYRGFDTLGEEFILFASVTGVILLLREEREIAGVDPARAGGAAGPERGEALRCFGVSAVGPILVVGAYVVMTGHLSVGGGFQGGVVLAAAWVMVFLAQGPEVLHRLAPTGAVEWAEAVGAGGFVLVGCLGAAAGLKFLANVLPLGTAGALFSSGTILLSNCLVGVEVAAGLVLLLREFLKPLEAERE